MKQLNTTNELDSLQAIFYSKTRPTHELYKLKEDPHELHNLASNSAYAAVLQSIFPSWKIG